jgi:hypothetical protein
MDTSIRDVADERRGNFAATVVSRAASLETTMV